MQECQQRPSPALTPSLTLATDHLLAYAGLVGGRTCDGFGFCPVFGIHHERVERPCDTRPCMVWSVRVYVAHSPALCRREVCDIASPNPSGSLCQCYTAPAPSAWRLHDFHHLRVQIAQEVASILLVSGHHVYGIRALSQAHQHMHGAAHLVHSHHQSVGLLRRGL
jgi:hypothetical protein